MTDFEIFKRCFPQYDICEQAFTEVTADSEILRSQHGFAYFKNSNIRLIAVLPEYQKNGEGKQLLTQCEQRIKNNGFDKIVLGGELFCGAYEDSHGFFEKHGYGKSSTAFADMELPLSKLIMPPKPEDNSLTYGFFSGDIKDLHSAVHAVEPDWVQYFDKNSLVFCAFQNGEIASFCIVDEEMCNLLSGEGMKIGSVGCVGTVPKFRKRGIGLYTVALACRYLNGKNCDKVTINYTALMHWYGKLGAKPYIMFRLMDKKL